jgi:hypothetical protein
MEACVIHFCYPCSSISPFYDEGNNDQALQFLWLICRSPWRNLAAITLRPSNHKLHQEDPHFVENTCEWVFWKKHKMISPSSIVPSSMDAWISKNIYGLLIPGEILCCESHLFRAYVGQTLFCDVAWPERLAKSHPRRMSWLNQLPHW